MFRVTRKACVYSFVFSTTPALVFWRGTARKACYVAFGQRRTKLCQHLNEQRNGTDGEKVACVSVHVIHEEDVLYIRKLKLPRPVKEMSASTLTNEINSHKFICARIRLRHPPGAFIIHKILKLANVIFTNGKVEEVRTRVQVYAVRFF